MRSKSSMPPEPPRRETLELFPRSTAALLSPKLDASLDWSAARRDEGAGEERPRLEEP